MTFRNSRPGLQAGVGREEPGEDGVGPRTLGGRAGGGEEGFAGVAVGAISLANNVGESRQSHPEEKVHELDGVLPALGLDQVLSALHELTVSATSRGDPFVPFDGGDDLEPGLKIFDTLPLTSSGHVKARGVLQVALAELRPAGAVLVEEAEATFRHEAHQLFLKRGRAPSSEVSETTIGLTEVPALLVQLIFAGRDS